MMNGRSLIVAFAAIVAFASSGPAQQVRGTVADSLTRRPIEGAFVSLRDERDRAVSAVLTDSLGRFALLALAPGSYTVRAERIGQRTIAAGPLVVRADTVIELNLLATVAPIALDALIAEGGDRRCTVRPAAVAAARLWDEARKALEITLWARGRDDLHFRSRIYERDVALDGLLLNETIRTISGSGAQAFRVHDATELARSGFAQVNADSVILYGADAELIVSDAFLDAHCFEVVNGSRDARLVGLRFRPVARRGIPDIEGVLWLDRSTAELRHLEYNYVDIRSMIERGEVTGHTAFRRLEGGRWIIQDWWIRAPRLFRLGNLTLFTGWHEQGGEVLEVFSRLSHSSSRTRKTAAAAAPPARVASR